MIVFGMNWHPLVIAGCLASLMVNGATAAATKPFRIANWSGAAYSGDQTRQFERCAASFTNAGGIVISYAVDRDYRWHLSFSNPTWNFIEGYSWNSSLKLGDGSVLRSRAVVVGSSNLEIRTEDGLSLFAALWTASQLQVTAGGLTFEFELISSNEVLSALAQCVLRQTGVAPRQNTARLAGRIDPAARDEAKAFATEILSYARIADVQMLPPSAAPAEGQAAAAWKTQLVTSTVDVVEAANIGRVDAMPMRIVEGDLRKCRGGFFFTSAMQEIDQLKVARTFTSCQTPESTIFVYYIAIARPKGGFYLLSSRSLGGGFGSVAQQQTELVDAKLRAVLMTAVSKVAQEGKEEKP